MKTLIRFIGITAIVLACFATGFAQKDQRLMATVTAIQGHTITVRTIEGETRTAVCTAATKFNRNGQVSNLRCLRVGDHVVLWIAPDGKQSCVTEIHFGASNDPIRK
jgi:hypothetical protein